MRRHTVALLTVALVAAGCDLPTDAEEARERLGKDQEARVIPIHLPMPELSVTLAEQLSELSDIVDTTDLSFTVDPDTFAFGLDSLLTIDPVDPDPVTQGYEIVVADFSQTINVTLPAVPIALPGVGDTLPLPPVGFSAADSAAIGLDLSGTFTNATFATGSALQVTLTTDATSTVTDVTAAIRDGGGARLAASADTLSLSASQTGTITIDLGSVTLPATFDVLLSWVDGSSIAPDGDELILDVSFVNAEVTAATGVAAGSVTPVSFADTVVLDQTGDDFSSATLAAGTVAVDSFESGTLEFTPTFNGDLTGFQVGGATPDSMVVSGVVGPPTGASTVDVVAAATVVIGFSGIQVQSVTLNEVSMAVDQTVTIAGTDSTLNDLERLTIETGTLRIDIANRLGVSGPVTLTLTGMEDGTGSVITEVVNLQPSPDGNPVTTTALVDLAGAVITPDSLVPSITGTISGTDVTVTPAAAAEAVTVDPFLSLQAREVVLAGVPDLQVRVDEQVAVAAGDIDVGDLDDLLEAVDFNDVTFTIRLENETGMDVRIDSFRMTLLDTSGAPILTGLDTARVELSNDTSGAVLLAAATVTTLEARAEAFVNQLLDEVAAGRDVLIAAAGIGSPDADSGSIALGDSIRVIYEISLGPDVTIDPDGIRFDKVVADALDLDDIAADFLVDLSEDLVSAEVEFEAVNGMPLGMSITMALAPTPSDTIGFDPFAADPNILLPEFLVAPAQVDSAGRATTPTVSEPSAVVDPAQLSILAEGKLGMAIRARILGPAGGRARLQPTDSLALRPLLKLEIRVGGGAGGGQ